MMRVKRVLYRVGLRPKRGSIWYSPSLSVIYAHKDADYVGNLKRAMEAQLCELSSEPKGSGTKKPST